METINDKFPKILFYDGRKWREDIFYGDVQKVIKNGKRMKKFGYDVIRF